MLKHSRSTLPGTSHSCTKKGTVCSDHFSSYNDYTWLVQHALFYMQVVREHYGTFAKREATMRIRFEDSKITLSIPEDGLMTREGWRIIPFSFPTVSMG